MSWSGALIGLAEGFVDGAIGGLVFAAVYNCCVRQFAGRQSLARGIVPAVSTCRQECRILTNTTVYYSTFSPIRSGLLLCNPALMSCFSRLQTRAEFWHGCCFNHHKMQRRVRYGPAGQRWLTTPRPQGTAVQIGVHSCGGRAS